jgi:hypothetical protein
LRVVGWRLEVEGGKIEMQRLNSQVEISSQNSSPSGEGAAGTSAKAGEVKLFI